MANIQSNFSINDLENLSGIKAHTIRIWEKRYNLFTPERHPSGIRYYNIDDLKKLLNVAILNNAGIKISKIAHLSINEIMDQAKAIAIESSIDHFLINQITIACLNYDKNELNNLYNELSKNHDFESVFEEYLIPLLFQIGINWQSNTINLTHEHFFSYFVRQKLFAEIDKVDFNNSSKKGEKTFVLFLPDGEDHELGLLYAYYSLLNRKHKAIYLGSSVPLEELKEVLNIYQNAEFISSFTIAPALEDVNKYLNDFKEKIDRPLFISGKNVLVHDELQLQEGQTKINTYQELRTAIE